MGVYIRSNDGSERMSMNAKVEDIMPVEKSIIAIITIDYGTYHKIYDEDTKLETVMKWAYEKYDEMESEGDLSIELVTEA